MGSIMSIWAFFLMPRVVYIKVNRKFREEFDVGESVHQGSVLSLLLFIMVLRVLSHKCHTGVSCKLLYTLWLCKLPERMYLYIQDLKLSIESKGL